MIIHSTHFYIIDDDRSFGKSLARLLSAKGFLVGHFRSAQSFFDAVPATARGYVIVDIKMPDMDGFFVIDKMKELHYDMPVIMVTGHAQADARDMALQKGALGFLQKSFNSESLFELIESSQTAQD